MRWVRCVARRVCVCGLDAQPPSPKKTRQKGTKRGTASFGPSRPFPEKMVPFHRLRARAAAQTSAPPDLRRHNVGKGEKGKGTRRVLSAGATVLPCLGGRDREVKESFGGTHGRSDGFGIENVTRSVEKQHEKERRIGAWRAGIGILLLLLRSRGPSSRLSTSPNRPIFRFISHEMDRQAPSPGKSVAAKSPRGLLEMRKILDKNSYCDHQHRQLTVFRQYALPKTLPEVLAAEGRTCCQHGVLVLSWVRGITQVWGSDTR